VCLGRPGYAPPLRAADLSSSVAVVWRKPERGFLPAEAEPEFAKIAGNAAATPERLRIPWQPYASTSAERLWEWMVVVADPARR
jgi:hypothetical protein